MANGCGNDARSKVFRCVRGDISGCGCGVGCSKGVESVSYRRVTIVRVTGGDLTRRRGRSRAVGGAAGTASDGAVVANRIWNAMS